MTYDNDFYDEFLEWQRYLAEEICKVFGVSAQELGVTTPTNQQDDHAKMEEWEKLINEL